MRKLKAMLYAWLSEKYMHDCSNFNTLDVRKGCRSKAQSRAVFAQYHFPHARGQVFFWPWVAHHFVKEHGFPVVIKPNVSGYSRGSYFPINTYRALYRAIILAKIWWPKTMIEQYLEGANYRVLTTRNGLLSVIRRYPPFVSGNGEDSISTLIAQENMIRQEMNLHPTIYPIRKSRALIQYLKKQQLTLASVPAKDQQITLFHRVALAPGGIVETIEQTKIPTVNRALFIDVVKKFGANILGIDVIFARGIEVPYTEQEIILVEVNSRPYIKMHHYPRYGKVEDLHSGLAELEQLDIHDKDIF